MAQIRTEHRLLSRLRPGRGIGVMFGCALIVANSVFALVVMRGVRDANALVEHTEQVLTVLYDVRGLVRDAATAQASFLLTGDPVFRESYAQQLRSIETGLVRLHDLVQDNADQQALMTELRDAIRINQAAMAADITRRDAEGHAIALTAATLEPTLRTALDVRKIITRLQSAERALFKQRQQQVSIRATAAELPMVLGTIGGLALIGFVYRLMATESSTRAQHVRDRTLELGHAISALRQRGLELRSREAQLRLLIEATPAAIAMFDRDMRFIAASERFRADYRLGEQTLIGRDYYELFPETPPHWRGVHRRCLLGATERAEEEPFHRVDGAVDWVRWEVRPWFDAEGNVGGVALFSEVITARKLAERALADSAAQLRQAQKMEAVGQLTGGIAHDFNNMLGVIIGNVEFLQDAVRGQPAQEELAEEILNVALSGAAMTRRLLAFARKQPLKPEVIDLRQYLPTLQALLARTLGERIRVSFSVQEALWLTRADSAQVGECMLNLAINARDAMPEGGQLIVAASNAALTEDEVAQDAGVAPGDYVLLSVTDTGSGMPREVLDRALEPFFTTKDAGKGTGLGLSMVYGFARQSGGHLKIYSEVGVGTTVQLYLPRVTDPSDAREASREPLRLQGGAECILVVDDNARMAEVARRHLTFLGYTVVVAHGGEEALSRLAGQHFNLLFSDIVMPDGMSGYELARAAVRSHPGLKVLLASGYAGPLAGRLDEGGGGDYPVLRKPYQRPELAAMLRAVLDAPWPAAVTAERD